MKPVIDERLLKTLSNFQSDMSAEQFMLNTMVFQLKAEFEQAFCSSIQRWIPDFTMQNASQYMDRISAEIQEGQHYPRRFYLDREINGGHFIFEMTGPPEPHFDYATGKATFTQGYRIPYIEPDPILIDLTGHEINSLAVVHYDIDQYHWINGTVYAAHGHDCYPGSKESEWEYQCADSCDTTDDRQKAKVLFTFKFCWRGVWEGRVYFPNNEEYWGEELAEIAEVWRLLQPQLKDLIKGINSNARDD